MVPWDDRYLTAHGLGLHYLDWGNPKAAPLLHLQGLCSHAHTFDPSPPCSSRSFHVPDGQAPSEEIFTAPSQLLLRRVRSYVL